MWGREQIRPEDAIQGTIGNCWLISAAMSIAEQEDRLKSIFKINEINSAGVYAAQLYLLGVPITVVIDDYLPLQKQSERQTMYAEIGEDGAIWGTLFEKFYAKYFGNYEMVDAGVGSRGIEVATGSPFKHHAHIKLEDPEALWKKLMQKGEQMVTSGSYNGPGTDQESNEDGLPYMHAFSILGVYQLNVGGQEERLV